LPRGGGLSDLLTGALIPLCCWGLISTLVLHLIELRSLFVQGGEWRLRQATLAFAAAVILIQRLSAIHGKSVARAYAVALGAAITLFALHNAYAYRLPAPPLLVFAINEILFLLLWWVGHSITAACSADLDKAKVAAESGILSRQRSRLGRLARKNHGQDAHATDEPLTEAEREARWAERLPKHHPGRVILYFSLFAVPAFGLGIYLFDAGDYAVRLRMGALLFLYLWCAFALLFLSSLGQLHAYFEARDVSLPEQVGLTWLAIGFSTVTAVLLIGIFLPQPPSLSGLFVRDRIVSVYRGWESRYGVKDSVGSAGAGGRGGSAAQPSRPLDSQTAKQILNERYAPVDQLNDPGLSAIHRNSGWEPEYRNVVSLVASASESFRETFDFILKVLLVLAIVCGLIVAYAAIVVFWRGLSAGLAGLYRVRAMRAGAGKRRRRKKDELDGRLESRQFSKFANPFLGSSGRRDGHALVCYLWEAMLAFCADRGAPCSSDQTPREFVGSHPAPLEGFEKSARYIANLFVFSEFSDQTVPDSAIPGLKEFWTDLQRHASRAR